MKTIDMRCKVCGGDLKIESRFTKTIVCRYCNTVYLLENNSVNEVGVTKPFEALSIFKVGASGIMGKKQIRVLGRIRLQDNEDIWDEWYVLMDNKPFWIEESSDTVVLISSTQLNKAIDSFENIRIGQVVTIDGKDVFISERGDAKVIGIEGEFTGRVKPNDEYKFIQGSAEKEVYMVEYYKDEIKTFKGQIISLDDITLNS